MRTLEPSNGSRERQIGDALRLLGICGALYCCSLLSASAADLRPVSLTLDYLVTGYDAPYFYGIKLGIFKKHGIDLTVTPGTGSTNTIQAVVAEQSMFGQADGITLILAADKGVIGATMIYQYLQSSGAGVMFKANSGIVKPSDIAGHTVGYNVGAVTASMLPLFLHKVGIPSDKVTLVNTTSATMVSAFIGGQFDVAPTVSYDSFVKLTSAGYPLRFFLYRDYGLDTVSTGIIVSPQTMKDGKLVSDFVAAVRESVAATRANPEAAATASKDVNPSAPAVAVQADQIRVALKLTSRPSNAARPAGYLDENAWRNTVKIMREAGALSGDVDISKLINNTFVEGSAH